MSITGLLTQISPQILTSIHETPSLLDLFDGVDRIDEEPKIDNLYGLSSEQINLLREMFPNPEQVVGEWTLHDFMTLEDWKSDYPEDFNHLKSELGQIIIESKASPFLDLGREWHFISYIFTGSGSMEILPFLIDETGDGLRVNAILCGQKLDEEADHSYYLDTSQVQDIAEALSRIPQEAIRQRIQDLQEARSQHIYSFTYSQESVDDLLEFCLEVKDFYTDAMNRENAMLISIA